MYRLQYRNFGAYEALVFNHTVGHAAPTAAGRALVRAAQDGGHLDASYQQGTFAPADGDHRWMGSAAMDHMGNIAVGYSVSERLASIPPSATPAAWPATRRAT